MQIYLGFAAIFLHMLEESCTFAGKSQEMSIKERIEALQGGKEREVFVLMDSKVAALWKMDLPYPTLRIEAGEENKSIATVMQVWEWLTEQGATREAVLVNIGGGVVCDLGGFAAATYLRGIDYINVPTTLLAMVDAATGGKTGVNFKMLKNRVGAFHMPKAVIIKPQFIETLPPEEFLSGYGEMLKTALLTGEKAYAEAIAILESAVCDRNVKIGEMIEACRAYKEHIVSQDPEEKGLRKVLNFGHTVGHAIEEIVKSQESRVKSQESRAKSREALHGYCVVWGMVAELYLSVVLLGCPKEPLQQLVSVMLAYYGRPQCNCKEQSELIALMRKDKKNATADAINFTLLKKAGDPIINQVAEPKVIEEALDYLFSL